MKKIFIGALVYVIMFLVLTGVSYRMEKLDSTNEEIKYQNKLVMKNSKVTIHSQVQRNVQNQIFIREALYFSEKWDILIT
ncbi:MAG: hypothetical protein RSE91_02795 [Bacilli bacterium]